MTRPVELLIHCDGGARGNPGPAALGVSIQTPDGAEVEAIAEAIGTATNNVAEYSAVLRGLRRASELGARAVHVRSDSQLLIRQLNGSYKVRSATLLPLHEQVVEAARAFDEVTFSHVPREANARADELVNVALDAGARLSDGTGPRTWPPDWEDTVRGVGCAMCGQAEPEEDPFGLRIFTGRYGVAYLQRVAPQPGYAVVRWRGLHVAEPSELTEEEAAGFWLEVVRVGRALLEHFGGCKVNYQVLGNALPHLHAHVLVRYLDDPWPGRPVDPGAGGPLDPQRLEADARATRELLERGAR